MMKTLTKLLTAFAFLTLFGTSGYGSHMTGGDFSWTCVGPNTFLVTLNLFRDCSGIPAPLTANVNFTSTCGGNFNVVFPLLNPGGTQVSQLCPGQLPFSTCNGGTLTGNQIYTYQATVTLAPPCPNGSWTMWYSTCCRPGGIINLNGSPGIYISGWMNFAADSCNNSPAFVNTASQYPLQYVCAGTGFNYNFGVTEPDGDSLRYSLVPARTSATATVPYATGFTAAVPIPGISLDPASGQISFSVPSTAGTYVVNVQVDEYRRCTGEHLSTIHRDIQFVVVPPGTSSCIAPQDTNGILNSAFSGTGTLIDSNTIQLCVGQTFTASLDFFDLDTGQIVTLSSNITAVLPGATMTTVGTNPVTATISWTAAQGSAAYNVFTITAVDNSCPTPRIATYDYNVSVLEGVYAGTDVTICGPQQAFLTATGGASFNWSVLSGDPINLGVNFSCDTCGAVVATPSVTTVYQVIGFSTGSNQGLCNVNLLTCNSLDTITVYVVPDFTLTSGPDTSLCAPDSIAMFANTSPGTYNYFWNNTSTLSDSTSATPNASTPVTTQYTVTAISTAGCVKTSTNTITVTPPFPPIITATANDTVLCGSDTTSLNVILGAIIPSSCGVSTTPCVGPNTVGTVGSGTFSNFGTIYPAPYAGNQRTSRHQFLYRASELNAQGINGGKITSLAFNIAQLNGNVTSFTDYTIKLGCTSLNALQNNSWQGGLVQVFDPKTVTVAAGWNNHLFDQAYDWDGTTNIIVEICFRNSSFSQNHSSPFSTTGYISVVYYRSNSSFTNACTTNFTTAISNNRPNTQFNYCADPDAGAFNFAWTPNDSTISDTSIINPVVTPPPGVSSYTVIVTDTFGTVCADTSTVEILVPTLTTSNDTSVCPTALQIWAALDTATCSNGGSWQWSNTGLLNFDTIPNPTALVNQTTTFYVTYTDSCGCVLDDSVTVTVEQIAPLQLNTSHPSCGLNNGSVGVTTSGGFPPYQYSIDSGATWQTSPMFNGLSIGYHTFLVQDSLGCTSQFATDTLLNPGAPTIDSIITTDLSCFAANDGKINIFATGGSNPLTYSIDSGGTFLTIGQIPNLPGGDYWIVVKDAAGCVTFPAIMVTLNEFALLAIDSTITTNLNCNNDNTGAIAMFSSGGAGSTFFSVDNGANFQAGNTFAGLAAGNYTVVVQDSNNCQANQQVTLTEPIAITNVITVVDDSCYQSCTGSAVSVPAGDNPPFNFAWSSSGSTTANVGSLCAGSYTVTVTDLNGCTLASNFTVGQPSALAFDSINSQNITCFGYGNGSISLYVSGGTPAYSYSKDGGTTFSSTNTFNNLTPGVYNMVVRDAHGCEITSTQTITEPSQVVVNPSFLTTTICVNNCVNISAPASGGSGGPYTYNWTISGGGGFLGNSMTHNVCPTQNTTYEVYAEDVNGCLSAVSIIAVNIHDSLALSTVNNSDICPGFSTNMSALATGGDGVGYSYSWFPQSGLSNPNVANPIASPTQTTTYTLTVNDFCGSPSITKQVTVTVNPVPVVEFIADITEGCEPLSVQFTNQSSLTNECYWDFGDGKSSNDCNQNHDFDDAGTYDVSLTVTSIDGCVTTLVKDDFITVHPNPTPRFETTPNPTTLLNTKVSFVDKSKGDINFWNWNFGGLAESNVRNPSFEFPAEDSGSYTVELDVTTVHGCKASTSLDVRVGAEFLIWVPKAFSPNGDTDNDIFLPVGVGIQANDFQMLIYDRWGHQVFESNNPSVGWDGSYSDGSGEVPNGTYVWKIITSDFTIDQDSHEYTGFVTVIR